MRTSGEFVQGVTQAVPAHGGDPRVLSSVIFGPPVGRAAVTGHQPISGRQGPDEARVAPRTNPAMRDDAKAD